jgi:hypothetical protein
VWVPVLFFVRGAATDFLRGLAGQQGRSGFGRNGMLETWWGRTLVTSRWSRGAYGALKCACFCWLGLQLSLPTNLTVALVSQALVGLTVVFCVVRGLPVMWEGHRYLLATEQAGVASARPLTRAAISGMTVR